MVRKISIVLLVYFVLISNFLFGLPFQVLYNYGLDAFKDRKVVDTLYWTQKDSKVIDLQVELNLPDYINSALAAQVTYSSAGTGSGTITGSITPTYPATLNSGDLVLLQVIVRNTTSTPDTPSGFTLLYGPDANSLGRQWIYYDVSDGTEDGATINVTCNSGTNACSGRSYRFTNTGSSNFTTSARTRLNGTTVYAEPVTTSGSNRLAASFVFAADNNTIGSFTGESGGDWTEAVAEFTGTGDTGSLLQLQTAAMNSAGTIIDGSVAMSAQDPWGVRSIAFIPSGGSAVTYSSAGTGSSTITGSVTPTYPATITANDLVILQVTVRNTSGTPTTPANFTLLTGPDKAGSTVRQWLYYDITGGTEDGSTITVTCNSGTNNCSARAYRFLNAATSSFNESGFFGMGGATNIIGGPSVETSVAEGLAVDFVYQTDNNTIGPFTQETGGDWTEAVAEFTATGNTGTLLQLQTATMASAGLLSGGGVVPSGADAWNSRSFALLPPQSYTVSGNLLPTAESGNEPGQCDGSTQNLSLRVNGGSAVTTYCTDTTGAFTFSSVLANPGDTITIYSTGADKANRVYVSDGSADSGVNLYKDRVAIADDQDGTVTIPDLWDYDSTTNDTDMLFDAVDSGTDTLTTESGIELHINTGDTFDPGGTVTTTSGNLHIDDNALTEIDDASSVIGADVLVDGGATFRVNANVSINGGDITTSGTSAIVTTTSGTPTVTMSSTGSIGGGTTPTLTFYNLATTGSGTTTIENTAAVNNDITIGSGTTLQNNAAVTVTGDVAVTGKLTVAATLTVNGGALTTSGTGVSGVSINYSNTPTLTINTAGTLGGGTGTITLYSLSTTGNGTTTVSSDIVIDNTLSVSGTTHTFSLGTKNMTVGSTVTNSGGITVTSPAVLSQSSGTTTIKSSSGGAATIGGTGCTSTNCTFGSLTFGPAVASAPTFTLGSAGSQRINVTGTLTIGNGSNAVIVSANTNNPIIDVNGNFVISASAGANAFVAPASSAFTVYGNWTNSGGSTSFNDNGGTVTLDGTTGSPTITSGGDSFNNLSIDNGGTAISWELQDALDVNNNILIDTSNTLDAKSGVNNNVNVGKNWTNNGTYTARSNTTTFDGAADTTQAIAGTTTFYNFSATTGDRVITFAASTTYTFSNNITITGDSCTALIAVHSASKGTTFTFTDSAGGTTSVSYIDAQDINATNAVTASNSVNSGNNTNTTIAANACISASTDTNATASGYSFQRKTFYDGTNNWLFVHDGDEIEVRYSTDGSAWSNPATAASGHLNYDTNDFSVWYATISSTKYVWLAVTTSNDILIRRGSLSSTDITWDSEANVVALNGTGASDTYSYPYISLDSSNYMWVGARYYDGSNYVYKTVRSDVNDTGDATWSGVGFGTTVTVRQISNAQTNANVFGNVVPLSSQDMLAAFTVNTAIKSCVWDADQAGGARWETQDGASLCETSGSGTNGGPTNISDATNFQDTLQSSRRIFRTASGTLYAEISGSIIGKVSIWKSSDGSSWSEMDSADSPLVGGISAAAIDSSNIIHFVYDNGGFPPDLIYSTFDTSTDQFGTPETIYAGATVGVGHYSIAIDSNDIPHVAFYEDSASNFVRYYNRVGGSWGLTSVATVTNAGNIEIAINEDNIPEISYLETSNSDLYVAVGDANDPANFTNQAVDTDVDNSSATSIAIDSSGNTWVAYVDNDVGGAGNDYISLVKHNDADAWTTWQSTITDSFLGTHPSLAIVGTDLYVFYSDDLSDVKYDKYTGSWLGETNLQTGTYTRVSAKWAEYNDNQQSTQIDYIYTDDTDVFWASLSLGTPGTQDSVATTTNGTSYSLSAVSDGASPYDVHLLYLDNSATKKVLYKRWDNNGASSAWQTAATVEDTGSTTYLYPSLTIDTSSKDLWASFADQTSDDHIYYVRCDVESTTDECDASAEWDTNPTSESTATGAVYNNWTSDYSSTGNVFGIWTNTSASPFAVSWSSINVSASNTAPSAPTTLYVNETDTTAQSGEANPVGVGDSTPVFSSLYNDSDSGDIANKYEVLVYSDSGCTSQVWDSGSSGTAMTNCTQGNRCADVEFAGTALDFDGSQYYWKMKYWDDDAAAGSFSDCSDNFTILSPAEQLKHGNYFFNQSTKSKYTW